MRQSVYMPQQTDTVTSAEKNREKKTLHHVIETRGR